VILFSLEDLREYGEAGRDVMKTPGKNRNNKFKTNKGMTSKKGTKLKSEETDLRFKAENLLSDYVVTINQYNSCMAELEMQLTEIRKQYEFKIDKQKKKIEEIALKLRNFAEENHDLYFGGEKKSMNLLHGTIGFRLGNPKLKSAKGFTWTSILELVKDRMHNYIRTKEEVAKDKILADKDNKDIKELITQCGIEIVQEESFYIEPKEEDDK
jgi:phage host-nuclease inhibitor protein Gam